MGKDDIEARPAALDDVDEIGKAHIEVGRENIHGTLPPHESYEGRHRFDPEFKWTAEEERRVIRKTDLKLMTWLCVMVSNSHNAVIHVEKLWLIAISSSGCNSTEEISAIPWRTTSWMTWV